MLLGSAKRANRGASPEPTGGSFRRIGARFPGFMPSCACRVCPFKGLSEYPMVISDSTFDMVRVTGEKPKIRDATWLRMYCSRRLA